MIQQGRVAVNGGVMTELPILIDPQKDKVSVDDEPIKLKGKEAERRVYLLMNKPKGVYQHQRRAGRADARDRSAPAGFSRARLSGGRLDAESRGLLLLTNDGELTNQLTHPRYGVAKTYKAIVDGFVSPRVVEELPPACGWRIRRAAKDSRPAEAASRSSSGRAIKASWKSRSAKAATAWCGGCWPKPATRCATSRASAWAP
jgi:16S rRNA U516 pseudouridylate synthase RsuA-like enzyme